MAGISAQGLTFTFGGSALIVTNVSVNDSQDLIDGSHLGIPPAGRREWVGGFATNREVSCDVIYNSSAALVLAGTSGALSITGPLVFSGNATVQSSSISGSVGDLVKGSITLKVA
jgi:hypothetical protein